MRGAAPWSTALQWIPYGSQTFDYFDAQQQRNPVLQALQDSLVPSAYVPRSGAQLPDMFPVVAIVGGSSGLPVGFINRLRTRLSDLYLAIAEDVETAGAEHRADKAAARRLRLAQWAYIRQAYMFDRNDRLKGMSLYGRALWLSNAREEDPLRAKNCWAAIACAPGSEDLHGDCKTTYSKEWPKIVARYVGTSLGETGDTFFGLEKEQPKTLAERVRLLGEWLHVPHGDIGKREAFANRPQEAYDKAMQALERSRGGRERGQLSEARQQLLIAAALNCRPTDILRGHALNKSFDYDPLLRLATIDAFERLQRTDAAGVTPK